MYIAKVKGDLPLLPFPLMLLLIENEEDRRFLEEVYLSRYRLMYAQALLLLRSPAAAEDAVSESMLALAKKTPLLRSLPCNKLTAYVVITVKHLALNQLRKRKREDVTWDGEMEDRAAPGETEDGVMAQAGVERIKDAICALPEREKEILMMKYFRELSDDEIAGELKIRPVSVRVAVSRARVHLKALLQGGDDA